MPETPDNRPPIDPAACGYHPNGREPRDFARRLRRGSLLSDRGWDGLIGLLLLVGVVLWCWAMNGAAWS